MKIFLILSALFEGLLITFFSGWAGPYWSPVILLANSLLLCFLFLAVARKPKAYKPLPKYANLLVVFAFLLLSAAMFYKMGRIIRLRPVSMYDTGSSDVIPTIIFFVKRFLAGEMPYTIMQFPNYSIFPTYLPFTWMPYSLADLLQIDYRWVSLGCYWLVALYLALSSFNQAYGFSNVLYKLFVATWPLALWIMMAKDDDVMISYLVESLVAAYYLLVAISLSKHKSFLLAVSISMCLLSRYSLVFWVPLLMVLYMMNGKSVQAFWMAAVMVLFILLFYALPYLRVDPDLFKKGYDYYTQATIAEWKNAEQGGFWHLGNGMGFSKWIFDATRPLPVEETVNVVRKIHLVACLLTVFGLLLLYLRLRRKTTLHTYLLFSLKIYLSVFYAFVQIPYKYLFLLPVAVTAGLLLHSFRAPATENPELA